MKYIFFLIAGIFISIICYAQRPAQGPVSNEKYTPQKLGYKLFWEDQFKGDELDSSKWSVRGLGPRALGYVSSEAVKVEKGYLKLFALKRNDSTLSKISPQRSILLSHIHQYPVEYGHFQGKYYNRVLLYTKTLQNLSH